MVLELITNSFKLRYKPYLMFFEAIILTILSIFFAIKLFPGKFSSIALLAFLTIGALPLFNKLYSYDSYISNYSKPFFVRHKKIISLLLFFFVGILFTFVCASFVLGENTSNQIFSAQLEEIEKIDSLRSNITGNLVLDDVSNVKFREVFGIIFKNNLFVVFAAIILSFFYGAGGQFLIVWNASLLSTVIVNYISSIVVGTGFQATLHGAKHGLLSFIGFIPHGLFEVLAYFAAGLAGAIFARDLFKGIFSTPFKWHATKDFLYLFLFALICLLIGALIEASYFV